MMSAPSSTYENKDEQVNTVLRNTDEDPASIPTENPPQESQVEERQVETSEPPKPAEEIQEKPANPLSFRKRPRKGIPHRAPFF
ncbi:hypothetical protein RIF29_17339 [Crotalaria pallida]|uniref:Uncharacterized protein n=1 Tax=Crotalaria pallida TaxID=3830 RepID=A0AAN9ICV8_CROPI